MSEYAKLYQEIQQIEEILSTIVELNIQKNESKAEINETLEDNNDIITQINIKNYLHDALT